MRREGGLDGLESEKDTIDGIRFVSAIQKSLKSHLAPFIVIGD